ncbi:MAG: carbon-nitrogen hydrolase family protein [Armatimonadetes bacterium]|nr:carbon-nitrogen hydrolase family protein [Armatimonadota bacterium]
MTPLRVASIQADVVLRDPMANARFVTDTLVSLSAQGVQLAVFPEAFLTGYCFDSESEAVSAALPTQPLDEALQAIDDNVNNTGTMAVVGFAEVVGNELHNTAAIFEPGQGVRYYRKTHLPELGLDRFVTPGSMLPVFNTSWGKLGVLICFDVRQPEAARSLALQGADIIALPTNWPTGAEISADVLCVARAAENKVYVVTANRVGTENGFTFIGKSKIIGPMGNVMQAAQAEATILIADLDLDIARNKRNITIAGKHETTVFESRRPDLYDMLIDGETRV